MGVKAGFPIVCAPMNQGRGKQSDAEFFAAGQGASFVVEEPQEEITTTLFDQVALHGLRRLIEDAAIAQGAA